tara:strand:- start:14 stop:1528 length:1515 start_codon:yes stop_codon:yes gene_type:complete
MAIYNMKNIKSILNQINTDANLSIIPSLDEFLLTSDKFKPIQLNGWIKTFRKQSNLYFFTLNDGSTIENIQIIFNTSLNNIDEVKKAHIIKILKKLSVGASLELKGFVIKPPENSKETIEILLCEIIHSGIITDRDTYLLNKGRVKTEVLRQNLHIRPKTNLFASLFRIRSAASFAVHSFFQKSGFLHLDPNMITTSDCEGAGEVFSISAHKLNNIPKLNNKVDYSKSFFKKPAYLTVSSQLQLEALSSGLGNCYTTNPSFRAEKSSTSRHLASFTHIEYEMSFADLNDLMDISEKFVKYVITYVLDKCKKDYEFIDKFYTKGIINRLQQYNKKDFKRITYNKAIDIIDNAVSNGKLKLNDVPKPIWGDDLGSVCEKYIAEQHFKLPVLVYNYPKKLKSFYMKEDVLDNTLVNCMDLLVPYIGELIGSSVREDNYDKIIMNMKHKNIDPKPLHWYLDLRKNGSWRHCGAGLGFERLVGMLTMNNKNFNIRDCIPFPVAYNECKY